MLPLSPDPDESLTDRAAAGDRAAFAALVGRYGVRLLRLLERSCSLPGPDAEDVAQVAWLKAWRALPSKQPDPFHSWLFAIARHAAGDHRKHRARRPTTGDDVIPLAAAAGPPPDRVAAARDATRKLADCLERLKPEYRAAVEAHAGGEAYQDAADRLGVPIGTVQSRLSRGRQALRECLGADAP